MSVARLFFAFGLVFVFLSFSFVSTICASADERNAFSAIRAAEDAMVSAYGAVLEADGVGGNVSDFIDRLGEAGEFLATASMLYGNGDFDEAVRLAGLSEDIGGEVKDEALELRVSALNEGVQRMRLTILGSALSVVLVIVGSSLVWRFLKRHYS